MGQDIIAVDLINIVSHAAQLRSAKLQLERGTCPSEHLEAGHQGGGKPFDPCDTFFKAKSRVSGSTAVWYRHQHTVSQTILTSHEQNMNGGITLILSQP